MRLPHLPVCPRSVSLRVSLRGVHSWDWSTSSVWSCPVRTCSCYFLRPPVRPCPRTHPSPRPFRRSPRIRTYIKAVHLVPFPRLGSKGHSRPSRTPSEDSKSHQHRLLPRTVCYPRLCTDFSSTSRLEQLRPRTVDEWEEPSHETNRNPLTCQIL